MMSSIFSGNMQKPQIWCLKKDYPPPFLVGGSKERRGRVNRFGPNGIGGSECVFRLAHFIRGLGIATPEEEPRAPQSSVFLSPPSPPWIVQRRV